MLILNIKVHKTCTDCVHSVYEIDWVEGTLTQKNYTYNKIVTDCCLYIKNIW